MNRMKEPMVYVLKSVSPKTVDAIPVSHASNNTLNKVNVSFAYRYWRNIATEPKKANLEYTSRYIERCCYQKCSISDTSSFEATVLNY